MIIPFFDYKSLFLILNPYNFVPLTAHLKLEIYYPNELEHNCSQEVFLMALNDKFTNQEINMDTKDFHTILRQKNLKHIGVMNAKSVQHIIIAKFIAINS